jgi:hypothetical protein
VGCNFHSHENNIICIKQITDEVQHINLSNNNIRAVDIQPIIEWLRKHKSLTVDLSVNYCEMHDILSADDESGEILE